MTFRPKQPKPWRNWERLPDFYPPEGGATIIRFRRGRLLVGSSAAEMEFRGEHRWQWLVSVSAGGWRASDEEVGRALRDFDMEGAEEDNHESGRARKFFRLCEPRPGEAALECECKTDETVVVEPDGYTWSQPKEDPDHG